MVFAVFFMVDLKDLKDEFNGILIYHIHLRFYIMDHFQLEVWISTIHSIYSLLLDFLKILS